MLVVNRLPIATEQAAGSRQGCSHSIDDRRNGENIEESVDDDSSHGGDEDGDGDPELQRECDDDLDQERKTDDDEVGEGDC